MTSLTWRGPMTSTLVRRFVLAESAAGRTVGFEWGGDGRRGAYYLPACSDGHGSARTVRAARRNSAIARRPC